MNGYQVDLNGQYHTILISIAVGAALCLIYDVFRVFRLTHRPSYASVFIQDVLYCVICAIITYGLLLVRASGALRVYPLVGEVVGFLICRFTLSRVIMIISRKAVLVIRRIALAVDRAIFAPTRRLGAYVVTNICTFTKKLYQLLKKHLKHAS